MGEKFFLLSRRVQGSTALIVAVLVKMLGVDADPEASEVLTNGIAGIAAVIGLVRWVMHFFQKDERKLKLVP